MTGFIHGLLLGANYALLALGYTLVFGVMHLLTLAHGQVFIVSGVMALLAAEAGAPLWLVGLLAIGIAAVLSVATDFVSFRPVGYERPIAAAVSTIGFGIVLEGVLRLTRASSLAVAVPAGLSAPDLRFGSTLVSVADLAALGVAGFAMVVAMRFLDKSKWGMAMRAFGHDPEAVALLGVPVRRLTVLTLALAGALAGLAVSLLAIRNGSVDPGDGFEFGLIGLAVMTVGGIGSVPGAVVAGLALGVAQTLLDGFVYQAAIPWFLLIAVILVRPQGLFGSRPA